MHRWIAVICAGAAAVAFPASAAEIVPHRAVYTRVFIPLDATSVPGHEALPGGNGGAAASPESGGVQGDTLPPAYMTREVSDTCTAWVTTEWWESLSRNPDGSIAYMRSETLTIESKDGLSLRIRQRTVDNTQTSEWIRSFRRPDPTAEVTVRPPQVCELETPAPVPGALPRLFPMAYMRVLLDGLAAGQQGFIRPALEPCAEWTVETENEPSYQPPSLPALAGQPHWNLNRILIPMGTDPSEDPRYAAEHSECRSERSGCRSEHYGITANGVVTHMDEVDRGDGTDYWSLSELTLLPVADCSAAAPDSLE